MIVDRDRRAGADEGHGRRGPHASWRRSNRVSADVNAIVAQRARRDAARSASCSTTTRSTPASSRSPPTPRRRWPRCVQASEEARAAIADLRGENGPIKGLTGDVQQTLHSARDAMTDLAETTEALKRNFFFRGFFNRRGYFDLDDVSVAQYRQGALETEDRRVLRIWLGADVLFERDANGDERLSDGGPRAARFGDVAVRAVSAEESVRCRRIRPGRDRRRPLSQQSHASAARPRLHRRRSSSSTRTTWRSCRWEPRHPEARPAGTGMAWRWRCSCRRRRSANRRARRRTAVKLARPCERHAL